MILPIPSNGTSNPQEFLTQSILENSRFQNQDFSQSTFLNLLRQDPTTGFHDPFPRPFLEHSDPFLPGESTSSSHISSSSEHQPVKQPGVRDEWDAEENSTQKGSSNNSEDKKTDTSRSVQPEEDQKITKDISRILVEKNQSEQGKSKITDEGNSDNENTKRISLLGSQEVDSVDTGVLNDMKEKLSSQSNLKEGFGDGVESQDTRKSQLLVNSQSTDEKSINNTFLVSETEEVLSNLQEADFGLAIKSDHRENPQQTEVSFGQKHESQNLSQVISENPQQVLEVVDLRTKQRSISQKQQESGVQQSQQEERISKSQIIRDTRNTHVLENPVLPKGVGSSSSSFGILNDRVHTQLLEDGSIFGSKSNEARTTMTLGSDSLLRFFDQKSARPWSQNISRLFGRNLGTSFGITEGRLELLRHSTRETPNIQQQFRLDQMVQDQNKSVMNPSSADQAQVGQYLKTAGNAEILKSAKFILRDHDKGEIKLILKPERLGEIKIHLSLSNNSIEAQILVDNKEVEAAFAENLQELMQAFQDQGFETGDFSITTREHKLASELLVEQQIQQVQIQEARWNELDPIQQEEIHIDLAI